MPTIPTILTPKGANLPANWPYDALTFWDDPEQTNFAGGGIIYGGVAQSQIAITLTSAQLLNLQTTAVQILNPPGAPPKGFGSALAFWPQNLMADYVFGGTPYTLGNADNRIQIEYSGQAANLISVAMNGLASAGASTFANNVQQAAQNIARTAGAGLGLEAKLAGTTPALTLGNGTITLTLEYYIFVLI